MNVSVCGCVRVRECECYSVGVSVFESVDVRECKYGCESKGESVWV